MSDIEGSEPDWHKCEGRSECASGSERLQKPGYLYGLVSSQESAAGMRSLGICPRSFNGTSARTNSCLNLLFCRDQGIVGDKQRVLFYFDVAHTLQRCDSIGDLLLAVCVAELFDLQASYHWLTQGGVFRIGWIAHRFNIGVLCQKFVVPYSDILARGGATFHTDLRITKSRSSF